MISFLFSSGAIKPTKTLHASDLKVGIPNLLLCIEMAIFGTLHLWAFAWQPYASGNQQDEVTDFYGNGKAMYHGGRYGEKALLDALNPLDLVKAVSRSLRWLFVGRKHRTLDPSYRDDDAIGLNPASPPSSKTPGAGTMPGGISDRYGAAPDEEGAVLLGHAQPNPTAAYSRSGGDLGIAPSLDEIENDSRYYSSNRLSTSSLLEPASHPPRPYSPYDGNSRGPFLTPSDSDQEAGIATCHSPHGSLQEQPPIPMPDPYQPPPLNDDYDHGRR